jgi:hypothetical protein
MLNLWQIIGLLATGWCVSKVHTIASGKWVPMRDHDNTVRAVAMNARREEREKWSIN